MKKRLYIVTSIALLIVCAIVLLFINSSKTKLISTSIHSIEYSIFDSSYKVLPVTISINGDFKTSFNGKKTFKGTIRIEGEGFSDPNKDKILNIKFKEEGSYLVASKLGYDVFDFIDDGFNTRFLDSNPKYSSIYVNKDFSKIAIKVYTPIDKNTKKWEGVTISGPSEERKEALKITNDLMATNF
ncbi:hypothetical protein [Cohnella sp. GCM10027633]|uniref:hypothetical protein n=1 Tax=unclassified Cohnella TaxID=2636738 RepID=UPI0036321ADE